MKSSIEPKHTSFQLIRGAGQNLKKMLGENNCPYVQSSVDIFHAFEPISATGRQILIAGAMDEYCRIVQWNLLATGEIEPSRFSADCALVSALNHDASRVFLVQSLLSSKEKSASVFHVGKIVTEACSLMGYEFVDYVVIVGKRYFSTFERPEFAVFANSLPAIRLRVGEQHAWRWTCAHCTSSNVTAITAMKGHRERPIQYIQCNRCEVRSWLTTLPINQSQMPVANDVIHKHVLT